MEDLLKSGELPCLVATSLARAGHRHGRGGPGDPGRVAEVGHRRPPAHRPRRPRRGRGLARADLPQVPRRPARVRGGRASGCATARSSRRWCRATRSTCSPSRSWRSWPPGDDWTVPASCTTLVRRAYPFAELSRELLDSVLDMLDGRYPSRGVRASCGRGSSGTAWRTRSARARARASWRSPTRARSPTAASTACTCRTAGAWASSTRRWSTRRARARRSCSAPSTWRIEEITRDRVIVTPAPGAPGAVPFWKGDGIGPPERAGRGDRRVLALGGRPRPGRRWPSEYDLDERAATQPRRLPARAARRHARGAVATARSWSSASATRSATGGCACCRPFGGRVHAAWALALSARIRDEFGLESDAIWSDDGIIVHLPDADEPPRAELVLVEPDELEDLVVRELARLGAVRRALPRERRARAAAPARLPGQAHAAVAAAAEGAVAARGGQALRPVPDRARDLPRVPARRVRPARPGGAAARAAHARAVAGRGGDPARLAVRLVAAVRLRGHLHVRGRHAERRAARGRAVARPRPAARAARPGGAARADRPGRARGGGGRPPAPERAHAGGERRRPARRAARASAT